MRTYLKVFDIGLQNTFVYRWNFLLRSLFGIVPLLGTVYIWRAIFEKRTENIGSYDYAGMIFYFMLAVVVDNLVTPTEDEWQIAADIRDGLINSYITKPIHYLSYRLSLYLSYRVLYTAVTALPLAAVFFCFRQYITLPAHGITWFYTLLSLAMAGLLQFCIAFSLAMLAFWILEISTVVFILYSFEYFLSGHMFPIDIMPVWFQRGLLFLPFQYEIFFPISVFTEKISGVALAHGLEIQAGWAVLAYLGAEGMWRCGLRRYQAVGG